MTLVYIDGLEDLSGLYNSANTPTIVAGRTGNGIRVTGSSGWFDIRLPQPYFDTVTCGFAWRPSSISGTNFSAAPFSVLGDNAAVIHASMNVVNGNISVVRGNSTTPVIASTTATPFPTANRWYYVEVQIKLSDTVGFVNVNVDGVNVLTSATNLDTKNAGTGATLDTVRFGMGIGGTTIFDDIYLMAGSGDPFLGDCVVSTLLPSGNGFANQFVGSDSDSVDNYLLVDEMPPSSTDYVASSTVGDRDLYTLDNLPGSVGSIIAVAPTIYVAKDEVGARQVKPLLRGSTTSAGAALALDFAYAQKQVIYTTNPETGSPFTVAEVNALQAGVEVA